MINRRKRRGLYDTHAGRYYRKGDTKFFCPVCGFNRYRSDTKWRWDRVLVCKECWEPKHPQDELHRIGAGSDNLPPKQDIRPEPEDSFGEGSEGDL